MRIATSHCRTSSRCSGRACRTRSAASAPASAANQGPRRFRAPPTAKPDLSGIWITGALQLLIGEEEANAIRQADAAAGRPDAAPPRTAAVQAGGRGQAAGISVARRGIDDPMARCFLSGVPRITTRPLPFQIVQMPGQVILLYEAHHAFRIIPTDGRPHPDDVEPSFLGDSVAHWEGDTLVVDVIGFNEKTWLAGVGTIHSEKLHVTERYTRDSSDTIRYDVTIEDPDVFTKPWYSTKRSGFVRTSGFANTNASRTTKTCSASRSCSGEQRHEGRQNQCPCRQPHC